MLEELVRDDEDDYEDDERRNRSVLAAAALVTVVALLAAWLIWPRGGENPAPAGVTAPEAPSGAASPTEAGANGCPDMPSGEEIPTTGPPVTWEVFNGAVLPVSQEHGPAVVDGAVARCYAHTPTGALVAAVQIGYRILVDPEGGVALAREQTVPGQGQDALVGVLKERGRPGIPEPGELCQVAGYRFVTYTPDRAVVALAGDCGDKFQLTESRVEWHSGDWRQVREPDGSSTPTASVLPDLRGMTVWSGI